MNRAQRRAAGRCSSSHRHVEAVIAPTVCPWCAGLLEYPGQAVWAQRQSARTGEQYPWYRDVPDVALWWCPACGDGDMWGPDDLLVLA